MPDKILKTVHYAIMRMITADDVKYVPFETFEEFKTEVDFLISQNRKFVPVKVIPYNIVQSITLQELPE